jgi:hypothetical protein
MKVFVPMPDEGGPGREFAGERLVPYACGMAVLPMLGAAPRGASTGEPRPMAPATPAGPADPRA